MQGYSIPRQFYHLFIVGQRWCNMLFVMETRMYNNHQREGVRAARSSGLGILRFPKSCAYPHERAEGGGQVAKFDIPSMAAVGKHQCVERRCSLYTSFRLR